MNVFYEYILIGFIKMVTSRRLDNIFFHSMLKMSAGNFLHGIK